MLFAVAESLLACPWALQYTEPVVVLVEPVVVLVELVVPDV